MNEAERRVRTVCRFFLPFRVYHTQKKVISKREDYSQIDDAFSSYLLEMVIKVLLPFLRLFPLERQIESNPL